MSLTSFVPNRKCKKLSSELQLFLRTKVEAAFSQTDGKYKNETNLLKFFCHIRINILQYYQLFEFFGNSSFAKENCW